MEKFILNQNIDDWKILKDVAKELGYKNERDMINTLLDEFPGSIEEKKMICSKKDKKSRNIYDIPPKHIEFYNKLACRHSSTISGIIFRYLIWPKISEYMQFKESVKK